MKAIGWVLTLAGFGLMVTALATRAGDRGVLVPPPDARVESFVRELMTRRHDRAMDYLGDALRAERRSSQLQQSYDQAGLSESRDIEAELISGDDRRASARAVLIGPGEKRVTIEFGLSWQRGDWRIVRLPPAW